MTDVNRRALQKAAIDTAMVGTHGLLAPEHAKKFIQMIFDNDAFSQMHRKELRTATQGEITKIGVSKRMIRKKVENTDGGERNGVSINHVPYQTVAVRLPWEISEDTLRQNIEGENLENVIAGLMSKQFGLDLLDLHFNGDTADASDDKDFLGINDGWIKQIKASGHHVLQSALTTPADFTKEGFFALEKVMPSKYITPGLKWVMSPKRKLAYVEYLTERATAAGDLALVGGGDAANRPLGREIIEVPVVPDDVIMLVDPQNLVAVNTYTVRVRKTIEGVQAIMKDMRYYVVHIDDDAVIEEAQACAILSGLPAVI